MKVMHFDIETKYDHTLHSKCLPKPPYGNLKDRNKCKAFELHWYSDPEGAKKKMACEPRMNKIIAIEACDHNGLWLTSGKDEVQLLESFWHNIQCYDIISGFGCLGFDIPTIIQRSIHHGIEPTRDLTNQSIYRREPIYDTQVVLSSNNGKPEKGYDLSWYCRRYGLKEKTGKASDVHELWKEGKTKEISDYCRGDVLAGKELFEKIYPYYPTQRFEAGLSNPRVEYFNYKASS